MSFIKIPAYTQPSTALIADGLQILSAPVRGLVESSSGINDTLNSIDNQVVNAISTTAGIKI
jgi:hypothetical protein